MKLFVVISLYFLSIQSSFASSILSDNIRIESDVLGYALQYRVYTPDGASEGDKLPIIYITDGQWYISEGEMPALMDRLIAEGKMKPIVAVFIDNRNPDDLSENRRNQQFFCNESYARFFVGELLTAVESNYPVSQDREDRVIQGVSFGGFNAACFGLMAHNKFSGISMHSPANTQFLKLLQKEYKAVDKLPLKMFLSFGDATDNLEEGRRFRRTLSNLEYDVNYKEVNQGHNWRNWRPLLDDALLTFFATD